MRSPFDVPLALRLPFAGVFLGVELALIVTAWHRPDHVLGFQMFNASSNFRIDLSRRVRRRGRLLTLPITDGTWQARDARRRLATFRWSDRVRDPTLARLGVMAHAPYGVHGQLFRLQAALDDVAQHIADDTETQALIADVEYQENGRALQHVHLEGVRSR